MARSPGSKKSVVRSALPELIKRSHREPGPLADQINMFRAKVPPEAVDAFDDLVEKLWRQGTLDGVNTMNQLFGGLTWKSKVLAGICERCGSMMLKKSSDKRFCGDTCRVQATKDKDFKR